MKCIAHVLRCPLIGEIVSVSMEYLLRTATLANDGTIGRDAPEKRS